MLLVDYLNTKWNKWYEEPLTKFQTNGAITASLVNSHTAKLRAAAAAATAAAKTTGTAGGKTAGLMLPERVRRKKLRRPFWQIPKTLTTKSVFVRSKATTAVIKINLNRDNLTNFTVCTAVTCQCRRGVKINILNVFSVTHLFDLLIYSRGSSRQTIPITASAP